MSSSRRINIGEIGETPKKIAIFNRDDVPSSLSLATPQRSNNNNIKSLLKESKYNNNNSIIDDRPKTSRGKAMPSPDEFTSYVIPSPPKAKKDDDNESFGLNQPSYFNDNNNYPNFKNAIWSDDDSNDDDNDIRYGSYDSDDDDDDDNDDDDDEDEDEYIMKHRSTNYNTNNTNAFSTSFRHSNQDDFMKYLSNDSNRNQESINWKFDQNDYSPDIKDTDSDASDDDDDEYYGGESTDQSTKDSDSNEWWNFRADGIATLSDDGNPILEDDRMIALGCWLFGSALKA